ncbi:MAG: hypothetical protein WD689_07330 [Gaiellaceae bacterium]
MLDLAELISVCARMRGEGAPGDGIVWAATAAHVGTGALEEPRATLRDDGDLGPLEALVVDAESALAAHAERVSYAR